LELLPRGIVSDGPIDVGTVIGQKQDCRRGPDGEFLENSLAVGLLGDGPEQDEILVQEIPKLGIFVELLT
jgi:hypothetical protein